MNECLRCIWRRHSSHPRSGGTSSILWPSPPSGQPAVSQRWLSSREQLWGDGEYFNGPTVRGAANISSQPNTLLSMLQKTFIKERATDIRGQFVSTGKRSRQQLRASTTVHCLLNEPPVTGTQGRAAACSACVHAGRVRVTEQPELRPRYSHSVTHKPSLTDTLQPF